MYRRLITISVSVLLSVHAAFAQSEPIVHDEHEQVEIYFRQGSNLIDENYRGNRQILESFAKEVNTCLSDSMYRFRRIRVYSSVSPEGSKRINDRLAKKRAEAITHWIGKKISADLGYEVVSMRTDWDLLANLVRESPEVPYRDEVLEVITAPLAEGEQDSDRYRKLIKLRKGVPHRWLYNHLFPKMRYAKARVEFWWESEPAPAMAVVAPMYVPELDTNPNPLPVPPSPPALPEPKPLYIALKNNLLYDALIVPNIGLEVYLGKDISLVGNWCYAWWKKDSREWYHRIYGGDLAVRYWFGEKARKKPLTGHHAGLYGQMITYDFVNGGKGYLADRWSWSVGAEYGYSLPIARRLNLDFTLGVGYHWGEYKEYLPIDGHYVWQATKNRSYFGPTKLEASLVWLLGRGNYNKKGKVK